MPRAQAMRARLLGELVDVFHRGLAGDPPAQVEPMQLRGKPHAQARMAKPPSYLPEKRQWPLQQAKRFGSDGADVPQTASVVFQRCHGDAEGRLVFHGDRFSCGTPTARDAAGRARCKKRVARDRVAQKEDWKTEHRAGLGWAGCGLRDAGKRGNVGIPKVWVADANAPRFLLLVLGALSHADLARDLHKRGCRDGNES